ncbi:monosaccharide ABC transporter membrane protein (CUT2 family) [Glaciihabitans tibetensis]|uniref:Monosaccharide ABC transporter membrane protein (CUT2 family) n=1 Tax=Glaciihabitans tibetensis TaxID=1266600 RepID=A0A2T0VGP1_9MICO|nr:ABC transporter permease [Glaciihabitans tibetensis]PRY69370.1 monosaccharide ABC transporter membrane protein (CUT2 family) [Glaciihabitans tibetensis]
MSHQNPSAAPLHTPGRAAGTLRAVLGSAAGRNIGLVIALILLIIVGTVTSGDRFTNVNNILTIVRLASVTGVLAIGMTFVIIGGGIDLSVGSVLGLASVVATLAAVQLASESFWPLMIIVALAVGLAAGVINGIIIAYGNVVAFMATLAMLIAARGFAEILSNRTTQTVRVRGFLEFSDGSFLGIPTLVWIFILVSAAGWILLNRTTFGRRTVAIGGNREATRLAGINVKRHIVYLYALGGLTAGIAGVMLTGRTTSGTSTHGTLYELDAIAAVVVGGTLLAGGRGTIVGTVLGILIFNVLTNIFTQNNLNTSVQAITKGAIIVIAVLIQQRFAARGVRET